MGKPRSAERERDPFSELEKAFGELTSVADDPAHRDKFERYIGKDRPDTSKENNE